MSANSETRERIIQTAKQLIKQHGYRNMTIEKIAEISGVPKGSITYHFKKEDIIFTIFQELFHKINAAITISCTERIENRFQSYLLHARIFVDIIIKNKNNLFLFHEMLESDVLMNEVGNYFKLTLSDTLEDFGCDIDPRKFELIVQANLGASIFLIQQKIEDLFFNKSLDLVDFLFTIPIHLAGIPKEWIDLQIERVHQLNQMVDFSDIHFI